MSKPDNAGTFAAELAAILAQRYPAARPAMVRPWTRNQAMAKNPARYTVMFGLDGCYMPDSTFGTFELHTRRDFVAMMQAARAPIEMAPSAAPQPQGGSRRPMKLNTDVFATQAQTIESRGGT